MRPMGFPLFFNKIAAPLTGAALRVAIGSKGEIVNENWRSPLIVKVISGLSAAIVIGKPNSWKRCGDIIADNCMNRLIYCA